MSNPKESENLPIKTRDFVIPGANVIIESGESPMDIERLSMIVFQLAAANPDIKVHFWIKIMDK